MATKISETLSFAGGHLARPTRYTALIAPPPSVLRTDLAQVFDILCKSVIIPTISNTPIDIMYKGHTVKIPGRVNQEQTVQLTMYLDETHALRKMFEDWISGTDDRYYAVNSQESINIAQNKNNFGNLMIKAREFDETVSEPMNYFFEGCFPIEVSGPEYGASNVSDVQEFTVTLAFWRMLSGDTTGRFDNQDKILTNKNISREV